MKHAGSSEDLKLNARRASGSLVPGTPGGQSLTSVLVALALGMLLVAILVDAPVRALSKSLDPSVQIALRHITGFGNSAWPLGIGLALLGIVWFVKRQNTDISSHDLATLRSALILSSSPKIGQ